MTQIGNIIVIGILCLLVLLGLPPALKHLKGEGGCCGSGSSAKGKKKLNGPKMGETELLIEGMHCKKCKARVEQAINKLDGAVCKVNLKKKTARVSYSTPIAEEVLKKVVEDLGYEVKRIVVNK